MMGNGQGLSSGSHSASALSTPTSIRPLARPRRSVSMQCFFGASFVQAREAPRSVVVHAQAA